jgi:nucleotide-binding universal stress UspA family protein
MAGYEKILFPVDLSEVSAKIVPHAKGLADKFPAAEIHVLFVAGTLEHFTTFYVPHPSLDRFEAELIERAGQKLQEFTNEFFADYPGVRAIVINGDPAEEILNYIETEGTNLVIMGTHGRKGLEKVIFGSVADRVVKKSPVPVMTINPHLIK